MFRLAVPKGVHDIRVISFLKNEQEMVETEHFKRESDEDGLVHYIFPNMEEDNFRYIIAQLQHQGVTMIGVDTQLTESKIMKLANLIKEAPTLEEQQNPKWLGALEALTKEWGTKTYNDDAHKWESYAMDIDDLIKSWKEDLENEEEEYHIDRPNVNLNEQKLRKLIRKTIRE